MNKMKTLILASCLLAIAPVIIIFILYFTAMETGLPGRRGGPQDAFRHTYSSALTARYLSPKAVLFITWLCETDKNSLFDQMDIHNNYIGLNMGVSDEPDLYQAVTKKIQVGKVAASEEDTITWLPPQLWDNGL